MNFFNFVAENWSMVVVTIAVLVVLIMGVIKFSQLPNPEQIARIKTCLLAWVVAAEKDLGGGTGKVKLSQVYAWFTQTFPFIKNFVPFETFSKWVDESLIQMRNMLKENKNLENVINKDN